ncbi:MAG: flagellar protein FlgN [Proteobacteria bacterium]|nr:flagellar protein FlgN [Pseudomonadota bacterium]
MPPLSQLLTLLQSDLANTQKLADLLESEKQHLEVRELDALQQLLPTKAQLLTDIDVNRQRRDQFLQSIGINQGEAALREHLQRCADASASACLSALDQLKIKLSLCNKYNELNGLIISNSRRRNGQRLDILKGTTREQKLYTAQGGTTSTSISNSVQQA